QAEDGIRGFHVTGVQTCALPISAATLPEPALRPEVAQQVEIRTFRVGVDEQEWLRTNARAFADHPEQGALTLEDLQQREQEPWRSEERRVGKGSRRRQRQPLYSV